jgi:glycosyltransferase involved in cell wall biosynthesis
MNILLVIDSLEAGGAQRQLTEIAVGFLEKGHTVSFLVYRNHVFYNQFLETKGIRIAYILESNYVIRFLRMRKFIRNGKFDAVLSFLEGSNVICELAGLPRRKWSLVVGERSAKPAILKSPKLIFYRWLHLLADVVVSNSEANIRLIRRVNPLLPAGKLRVIYNIVNLEYWKPAGNTITSGTGKFEIVVAASQRSLKNLNGLIEAVAIFSKEEQQLLKISWYGDRISEPYYDDSFQLAQKKIEALHLEHLFAFYPATHEILNKVLAADAVGLFSFHEGFPNAICEGMACGKPVICSGVSDMPKVLSDCPQCLCDPHDILSIHNAIRYLLYLDKESLLKLGIQNRSFAERYFNKVNIVDNYLALLS